MLKIIEIKENTSLFTIGNIRINSNNEISNYLSQINNGLNNNQIQIKNALNKINYIKI